MREIRDRSGLNQEAFGALGGVHRNTQVAYETSKRAPDTTYLQGLRAAGVDVVYILTGQRDEGMMTEDETRLLDVFTRCSTEDRQRILDLAARLAEFAAR